MTVELNEGLESIGSQSFEECKSLETIILPSTVKEIGSAAFRGRTSLVNVQLNEGLEKIGTSAFSGCESLESITFPSTVKDIGWQAFSFCYKLVSVQLNEGLKYIAVLAFQQCESLESITIPTTVEIICREAFGGCIKLMNVQLNEGLKCIDQSTFCLCTSLESIRIPSTVNEIGMGAFDSCEHLEAMEFSTEIEEFVSETSLQEWWNRGVSYHILETYSFLWRHSIAERFRMLKPLKWRSVIDDMLFTIPTIDFWIKYGVGSCDRRNNQLDKHYDMIDSKLLVVEKLTDIATLIELALMVHRLNTCGAAVIIPNVLSFLMVDKWPGSTSEILSTEVNRL